MLSKEFEIVMTDSRDQGILKRSRKKCQSFKSQGIIFLCKFVGTDRRACGVPGGIQIEKVL